MTEPTNAPPEIPQSDALKEASEGDSLAEVMSRDPEGLSRQDRDQIIRALREHRVRIEAAEKSGIGKKRTPAGPKVALSAVANKDAADLGL